MESNPVLNRIMYYVAMLAVPFCMYGIIWIIFWLRRLYANYKYDKEVERNWKTVHDTRRPILYLRNFSIDGSKIENPETNIPKVKFDIKLPTLKTLDIHLNEENIIRQEVSKLGPLISIGDYNPNDIGISRIKSNDKEWKIEVEKCMIISKMIILRTSSMLTQGISWELKTILNNFLHKTLFFVESNDSSLMLEIRRILILKFPSMKEKEINSHSVPYYFWISEQGDYSISSGLKHSKLYKSLKKQNV